MFIVCSIVQGIGGSSMFTTSFEQPDNVVVEILMQARWWPGWILTVLLVGAGSLLLLGALFLNGDRPPNTPGE